MIKFSEIKNIPPIKNTIKYCDNIPTPTTPTSPKKRTRKDQTHETRLQPKFITVNTEQNRTLLNSQVTKATYEYTEKKEKQNIQ